MKLPRRNFLHLAAGAAALPAMSGIARAQTYPMRPVRLIVGFAPSGATDIMARLIGQWLSERLGQQFIVENRPGAASNIATEAVVNAPRFEGGQSKPPSGSRALERTSRAAPSFFGSKTRAQPCCIAPETVHDRSKPPAFACAQQGTRRGDVKNRMGRFDNIISVSLRSRASPAAADRV